MPVTVFTRVEEQMFDLLTRHSIECGEDFRLLYMRSPFRGRHDRELDDLNSFWRDQLSALDVDTINERECLCYSEKFSSWLANFERYVMPTVLRHRLPRFF